VANGELELGGERRLYPWEKLDEETNAAHAALISYRDCPKPRSLRRAAGKHYHGDAEALPTVGQHDQFKRWSRAFDWVSRVEEYDAWLDERKRRKEAEAIEKMGERHARQAVAGLEALFAPARALMDQYGNMPISETELGDLNIIDLIGLMQKTARPAAALQKAERLARGEPTEILAGLVEHDHRHLHAALGTERGRELIGDLAELIIDGEDASGSGEFKPSEPRPLPPGRQLPPGEAHPPT
jgi:hypothetical protein